MASQYLDWIEVLRLLKSAQQNGYYPGDGREYLVFIDAFIQTGDFDRAYDLTVTAKGSTPRNNDNLCGLWYRNIPPEPADNFNNTYDLVKQELGCSQ